MKESIFLDHTADVFDPSIRKRVNFSFVLSRTRVIIKFNALVKDTFFLSSAVDFYLRKKKSHYR